VKVEIYKEVKKCEVDCWRKRSEANMLVSDIQDEK